MNFAQRVATFDIDDVVIEEDDGVNFEREYLMGGGVQKSNSTSNVALLGDHDAKKDLAGLKIVVLSSLLVVIIGGGILFSCTREVNHNEHYKFCVLGMGISFLTITCALWSWIGVWRARKKDLNPMTLSHTLAVLSLYGWITYICLLYYYWKDRQISGQIPLAGVNRLFLVLVSFGAIAILLLFTLGTLSIKWKTGNVYRFTHYLNTLAILGAGGLIIDFGVLTVQKHTNLALWPVCWSIYFSMGAGGLMVLTSLYGFIVRSRPRLINFLVLLFLNFVFVGSSYFNFFTAHKSDGSHYTELYVSAIVGIASQVVMLFAFLTAFQWKNTLTA